MLERILIPLDGSAFADGILHTVERLLGSGVGAEVVLVRALTAEGRPLPAEVEVARRHLERARRALLREGLPVQCEAHLGDATEVILRRVEGLRPSLVAMATHGRSGVSRWWRGSVAERVLRRCPAPLLLANPERVRRGDDGPFQRILVPLDGSPRSAKVLPLVAAFARAYDAEVVLLRVAGSPRTPDDAPDRPLYRSLSELEADLEVVRARLERDGLAARARVVDGGSPPGEILEAVEAEAADLVALTTHGRTGLDRWAFGSVAEKVLRHCPVPLLVLRAPTEVVAPRDPEELFRL